MILQGIIQIFLNFLLWLISLLPSATPLSPEVASAFVAFSTYFDIVNSFFPVDTLFIIFGFGLLIEMWFFAIKIAFTTRNQLPF